MRDFLFLIVILASLPVSLMRPYIGGLVWIWIGLMNPHRYTWALSYEFPAAQLVAVATLLGLFVTPQRDKFPVYRETVLLVCLMAWFTVTTAFALAPQDAWTKWETTGKILVMTFALLPLFQDKTRFLYLLHVVALSIAFFSVKGAIFGLLTGGQYLVWGPPRSFIGDNNALALAELMVLPLLISLAKESPHKWLRALFRVSVPATLVAVVLSYSRGAFLGLLVVGFLLVLSSKRRALLITLSLVALLTASTLLPDKWIERMQTIPTYDEDTSALTRINSWTFAYRLALARPLVGGGFKTFNEDAFALYAPDPTRVFDAHSIYFEVLGEHGFVGLGLFLALILSVLSSLRRIRLDAAGHPSLEWIARHTAMTRISVISYLVVGAFLGLAYFDLFYYIVALIILFKAIIAKHHQQTAPARVASASAPEKVRACSET